MEQTPFLKNLAEAIIQKSGTKQLVYRNTQAWFDLLKTKLENWAAVLSEEVNAVDTSVGIIYKEGGKFEAEIQISGDVLVFNMHTNVFTFEEQHVIHTLDYTRNDCLNCYCGMIEVYNFLTDSLKYQRINDAGYLVCRIFINRENHNLIEGERPVIDLNEGFSTGVLTEVLLDEIIGRCVLYALEFDLWAPPLQEVKEISILQKLQQNGVSLHKTSKRLGFKMSSELNSGK